MENIFYKITINDEEGETISNRCTQSEIVDTVETYMTHGQWMSPYGVPTNKITIEKLSDEEFEEMEELWAV